MVRALVVLALSSAAAAAGAQSIGDAPNLWDVAVANGSGATTVSAALSRSTYVGSSDRLKGGFTVRGTFITGTVDLEPRDPRGIGSHDDVLTAPTGALLINVGFNAGYEFSPRLLVGMNLDVFGISIGGNARATLHPAGGGAPVAITVQPDSPNLFAGGSGDRGSLNSEFFVHWSLNDRYAIRGGLSHQLIGVKFAGEGGAGASSLEYRKFANLAFVGLRIAAMR
jgi:opacity protein-like surface antigen